MADPEQQALFLAVLDSLEEETGEPAGAVRALHDHRREARIYKGSQAGAWHAGWQVAAEWLTSLFLPAETAFRTADVDEEERWLTLLRDEVRTPDGVLLVALDGRLTDDGRLEPQLKLAREGAQPGFLGRGELTWGDARIAIAPTAQYATPLPAIDLRPLLEPETLRVRAALQLNLEIEFTPGG
jgi:hypothetical protein